MRLLRPAERELWLLLRDDPDARACVRRGVVVGLAVSAAGCGALAVGWLIVQALW